LKKYCLLLGCIWLGHLSFAQDSSAVSIQHGNKGFQFTTPDNRFQLQLQSRLQFRYAYPSDQDPRTFDDIKSPNQQVFKVNRARLKIGGHAYQPYLKYYFEYELAQSNLLDYKIMIEKWRGFCIKVGQWKTDFNRERVISSGQQQMEERSILTRAFTLDRQQGIAFYGNIGKDNAANFSYWLSILTGAGRGATSNVNNELMYVGRLQWNCFGHQMLMEGSDTKIHTKAIGSIALAAATYQGPYTRFSQAGGGSLDYFPIGTPNQYHIQQYMVESALMFKGFSWQHESHLKRINDLQLSKTTQLFGNYVQAGYFLNQAFRWFPKPLELALRHAMYTPNRFTRQQWQQEYTIAANWFFHNHLNKLTAEITWFELEDKTIQQASGGRFRLQWDISF
jgi:phosphate-selective porin OprO and OprP